MDKKMVMKIVGKGAIGPKYIDKVVTRVDYKEQEGDLVDEAAWSRAGISSISG